MQGGLSSLALKCWDRVDTNKPSLPLKMGFNPFQIGDHWCLSAAQSANRKIIYHYWCLLVFICGYFWLTSVYPSACL